MLQWFLFFCYPLSFWCENHVEGETVWAYNEYNLHPRGLEMQFTKPNTKDNSLNIDFSIVKLFLWRLKKKSRELSHFPLLFTRLFGIWLWQLPEAWHFSRAGVGSLWIWIVPSNSPLSFFENTMVVEFGEMIPVEKQIQLAKKVYEHYRIQN